MLLYHIYVENIGRRTYFLVIVLPGFYFIKMMVLVGGGGEVQIATRRVKSKVVITYSGFYTVILVF